MTNWRIVQGKIAKARHFVELIIPILTHVITTMKTFSQSRKIISKQRAKQYVIQLLNFLH